MNGDSQADSKPIFASNSTHKLDPDAFFENRAHQPLFMEESDSRTNYSEYGSCNSSGQNNFGLLRFRSAPSSLLQNFASGVEKRNRVSSRFCSDEENSRVLGLENDENSDIKGVVSSRIGAMGSQFLPQYPRQSGGSQMGSLGIDGASYRGVSSMGMDHQMQGKMGSGLMRQNSSPAGLFSQNGYVTTRGIGSYRLADDDDSRLRNSTNFSSGMSSSLGILSRIAEVDEASVGNNSADHLFYGPGFAFGSWNDSSNFTENFTTGIKRELENDLKLFAHPQNSEPENMPHILSHHLSLPKNSAEMANVQKLLHFQDTIPCKIRAKRGCATHPRSIAERVRRTRISERMRKLQDLVPNMDKQTNTADMLDLAVEYIKNLQNEYKILSETRANCKCLPSQKTVLNQ